MDLAIHIITACCMVAAGVALVFLFSIVTQLEIIVERMNKRVDEMKAYGQNLEDLIYKKEQVKNPLVDKITEMLIESLKKKQQINVVDKPLDFPNDHK